MELLALLFKDLVCIFFSPTHALQFCEVFTIWQCIFQLSMLVLVCLELSSNALEGQSPFFLKQIVFLKASSHMPFVLLVVLGDLRFTLLEDFNFKATLTWPLLSQILIELLNRFILQVLDLRLNLVPVVDLL